MTGAVQAVSPKSQNDDVNARGLSAPAGQARARMAAAMHVHIWYRFVKVLFRSGALLLENANFSHVLHVRVWPFCCSL